MACITSSNSPRAALAITAATLCVSATNGAISITSIGTLSGDSYSRAWAINADGTAVAGNSGDSGADSAVLWKREGGIHDFGTRSTGLGDYSYGLGVSGDGHVVAGYNISGAFRWSEAEGISRLAPLPGNAQAGATSVDFTGSAIAGFSGSLSANLRAVRWGNDGTPQDLGVLPGATNSRGAAISTDGLTVVGSCEYQSSGQQRAFRWRSTEGMRDLGFLPGATTTGANAVSADGSCVVGYSAAIGAGGFVHAFLWNESMGMQDLGTPAGEAFSLATGVNGDGSIVVGRCDLGALFWTRDTGMVLLAEYLSGRGLDLRGWDLQEATAISADGSSIAGIGIFEGQTRGWVVSDIPSPGTGVIACVVCVWSARRRRSR